MNKTDSFEQFLTTQSTQIEIFGFITNLLLTALLAYILTLVYVRYGRSISNRKSFSANFVLVAMTTMVIISIVKSSLALSLGLVGALSIVRFRAAIKEPEELAYLFLNIAIGLGFGANQRVVTIVGFVLIITIVWLKHFKLGAEEINNLHLTISSENRDEIKLEQIVDVLKKHARAVELKRFDETKSIVEGAFNVVLSDIHKLNEMKQDLKQISDHMRITFVDQKHLQV